jgi:aromatic ring hydroxylase
MPTRAGREYIEGLREQRREVWLRGERDKNVTTQSGRTRRRCATNAIDNAILSAAARHQRAPGCARLSATRGTLGLVPSPV